MGLATVGLRMMKPALALWVFLYLFPAPSGAGQQGIQPESGAGEGESIELLASSVRELGLGEGVFVIGSYLTPEQVQQAQERLLSDTYPGTIKFPSGEVVVVADEKTHLILAVYRRQEGIGVEDVKQMIGHLMTRFGEPTTMAHDRLIYWAFGTKGKIEEKSYGESKATGKIDILATVKFNSTIDLDPGMDNENVEEVGTIYYIITSDRLLNSYITRQ